MPELPEVETIRKDLEIHVQGGRLSQVELHGPGLRFPFAVGFASALERAVITKIDRRGKISPGLSE